jgi:hypothetical protein
MALLFSLSLQPLLPQESFLKLEHGAFNMMRLCVLQVEHHQGEIKLITLMLFHARILHQNYSQILLFSFASEIKVLFPCKSKQLLKALFIQ